MKYLLYKSILFAIYLVFPFGGFGQITITSSDMPSANDTIRYSVVQTFSGIDFKSTGENKTWNFTSLKPSSQEVYHYKSSLNTPYVINFGFSAIGLKVADSIGGGQIGFKDVYSFYKKSTTKWEAVGIGFQLSVLPFPQSGKYSNTDEIYQFPLNYKDKDSVDFSLKVPLTAVILPIGNFFQNGNRINTVDGWGKISTPYQSDMECIRVKSIVTETDSIALAIAGQPPINFKFPANRIEYKWLTKTEKIPVLEVTGTEQGGTFTPTIVRYRDKYVSTSNPDAPVAEFSTDKLIAVTGEMVTLTNKSSKNPDSFLWTITPGTFTFVNGTSNKSASPQVTFGNKANYSVTLKATNAAGSGTTTKTNYISIEHNAGITIPNYNNVVCYPNPAKEQVTIEIPETLTHGIRTFIIDMEGKVIEEATFKLNGTNAILLNTSSLSTGRYSLIIRTENGLYYTALTILN